MKKRNYIKTALLSLAAISLLSSCLKDNSTTVDFSQGGQSAEIPLSGLNHFAQDAITTDTAVLSFGVNIASSSTLSRSQDITVDVDAAKIASYNAANPAIVYEAMPANAYTFKTTVVTIPAGDRYKIVTFTVYKNLLDPSKSYMLPIGITKADGLTISANQSTKYYHVIGNDFAGIYIYNYRRYNNGTGPGAGAIPSLGQGSSPDITNPAGTNVTISPISPTSFSMITGYNGQNVAYTVSFTRTVAGSVINYTNWKVTFDAANLKKWTDAGINNLVAPKFTVPPPATSNDPKFFELNYVSGGAAGRYIDDTYHK